MAPGPSREQGYWPANCKLFYYTGYPAKVKLFFHFFTVYFFIISPAWGICRILHLCNIHFFLFTAAEKASILSRNKIEEKGGAGVDDYTRKFDFVIDQDAEIHRIMLTVYQALEEKGYNPINQIVGYILSEDPTYITNHNQARTLIRKVDRDELLQILVRNYLAD